MNYYSILKQNIFSSGAYSIVPIRMEDRYAIMQWRNEQIYHLRQNKPLTKEDQDRYFETTVAELFDQPQPEQLLFSYLEGNTCIGYGGLVHINWTDRNAEISFIMDTVREEREFQKHWSIYLGFIEQVAFDELGLHKIYTYAFDLRPHLYNVLEQNAFIREAELKEHFYFNNEFKDVVIHTKIDPEIRLRRAEVNDLQLTYRWAIDPLIRKYALSARTISWEEHHHWFNSRITDPHCMFLIAENLEQPVGSIRFDLNNGEALISYLLSPEVHGKGLGKHLLYLGVRRLFDESDVTIVKGVVIKDNIASLKIFETLGYEIVEMMDNKITYIKRRVV
jgi:RimJ/RimL family protein N-acetyltransferase